MNIIRPMIGAALIFSLAAWTHGSPPSGAPVLTGVSLAGSTPASTNDLLHGVGNTATVQAQGVIPSTNSPTSCNITAGDTPGNFICQVNGGKVQIAVTSTGQSNLTNDLTMSTVSETLTVTATNGSGTGGAVTIPVTMYADGFKESLSSGFTDSNLIGKLAGYGVNRPPWLVAGADYPIGASAAACPGGVFSDPGSASAPTGVSINTSTHVITFTANNATLNCFDLSLEGGLWVINAGTFTGVTISNINLAVGTGQTSRVGLLNCQTASGCVMKNITADGGCNPTDGASQPWTASTVYNGLLGGGNQGIFKLSVTKNSCSQNFDFGGGTTAGNLQIYYNEMLNGALVDTIHNNCTQMFNTVNISSFDIGYNACVQVTLGGNSINNPGEGIQVDAQGGGTITGPQAHHNTVIAFVDPGAFSGTFSFNVAFHAEGFNLSNGIINNNYLDTSGSIGGAIVANSSGGATITMSSCTGNINPVTGSTITGNLGPITCN